jgi:hypothetical protein
MTQPSGPRHARPRIPRTARKTKSTRACSSGFSLRLHTLKLSDRIRNPKGRRDPAKPASLVQLAHGLLADLKEARRRTRIPVVSIRPNRVATQSHDSPRRFSSRDCGNVHVQQASARKFRPSHASTQWARREAGGVSTRPALKAPGVWGDWRHGRGRAPPSPHCGRDAHREAAAALATELRPWQLGTWGMESKLERRGARRRAPDYSARGTRTTEIARWPLLGSSSADNDDGRDNDDR